MHPSTRKSLEAFTTCRCRPIPHPLDIRRFNKFICEAFRNGDTRITVREFQEVLGTGRIDEWVIRYERGIELLRVESQTREDHRMKTSPHEFEKTKCQAVKALKDSSTTS